MKKVFVLMTVLMTLALTACVAAGEASSKIEAPSSQVESMMSETMPRVEP